MHPRSAILVFILAVFLFPARASGGEGGSGVAAPDVAGVAAPAEEGTVRTPEDPDDPRWCRTCHEEERHSAEAMRRGAHRKLSCNECHTGYQFDPHAKVELPPEVDTSVLAARGLHALEAYASCADCHEDLPGGLGLFPHGEGDPAKGPYCDDCHGDEHTTPRTSKLEDGERRRAMNERCVKCHEDPDVMKDSKITAGIVKGFDHTTHARLLALGENDVPGCVDCHGGHELIDLEKDGAKVCKDCHEDSTPAFVALASHGPFTPEGRPVGYWVQKGFAWLTFLTVMFFAGHILLDLFATFRKALRDGPPPKDQIERAERLLQAAGLTHRKGGVQRFDFHQRAQHMILAVSFVLLVLTGWPLTTHGIGASHSLMELFGGPHGAGLLHRIAGVGLAAAAVYHLAYIAVLAIRRKPCMTMMPSPQDLRDMLGNFAFFFGLRRSRPRFTRYGYLEKFDYWAVFWGMTIMVGTGVVRWFPAEFARYAPAWLYEGSNVAHTDEALLASMAIFFWHFYNVHLRPAVFPMSWVFIHGRASVHEMEEAHGAELDALLAKARAIAPGTEPEGGKGEAA